MYEYKITVSEDCLVNLRLPYNNSKGHKRESAETFLKMQGLNVSEIQCRRSQAVGMLLLI